MPISLSRAVFATALALLLPLAGKADAKPKQNLSNGCTMEQIQSPEASACMDQLNKDVMDGVRYVHNLFCDASGMQCCQTDGTRTFGCKKVGVRAASPGTLTPIAPAGTLQKAP